MSRQERRVRVVSGGLWTASLVLAALAALPVSEARGMRGGCPRMQCTGLTGVPPEYACEPGEYTQCVMKIDPMTGYVLHCDTQPCDPK